MNKPLSPDAVALPSPSALQELRARGRLRVASRSARREGGDQGDDGREHQGAGNQRSGPHQTAVSRSPQYSSRSSRL